MSANGSVTGRDEGKTEYEEFVLANYRALVDMAKKRTGFASPSIETFCRFDVGVWKDGNSQKTCYFVNECQTLFSWNCLWTLSLPSSRDGHIVGVVPGLQNAMHRRIQSRKRES